MSFRPALVAAVAGVLTLAVAACGSTEGSIEPAASGSAPSGAPGTIAVQTSEYAFAPASITVPAGEVTFSVSNVGAVEHEFEIFEGDQVVDEVEGLVPGLNRDLTVTLEPGAYTFVCKLGWPRGGRHDRDADRHRLTRRISRGQFSLPKGTFTAHATPAAALVDARQPSARG